MSAGCLKGCANSSFFLSGYRFQYLSSGYVPEHSADPMPSVSENYNHSSKKIWSAVYNVYKNMYLHVPTTVLGSVPEFAFSLFPKRHHIKKNVLHYYYNQTITLLAFCQVRLQQWLKPTLTHIFGPCTDSLYTTMCFSK